MIKYKYSKLAKRVMPLISWEMLIELQNNNRVTGKTTALCLSLISEAMLKPEERIHLPTRTGLNTFQLLACGGLIDNLKLLLHKLELDFLTISQRDITLTYSPYGYVTRDWVVVE